MGRAAQIAPPVSYENDGLFPCLASVAQKLQQRFDDSVNMGSKRFRPAFFRVGMQSLCAAQGMGNQRPVNFGSQVRFIVTA